MQITAEAGVLSVYRPAREEISSSPGNVRAPQYRPAREGKAGQYRPLAQGLRDLKAQDTGIPTSRASLKCVEKDQFRSEGAVMGVRGGPAARTGAESNPTGAETWASSRAILTSRAQLEYRPCGLSVIIPRLVTDHTGKREDELRRVARGTDKPKPRIPTLQGKNTDPVGKTGTVIVADKPQERPSERSHGTRAWNFLGYQG